MHNYIPYSILSSERWQKEKDYVEYGSQEIYKDVEIVGAIFLSYLIYRSTEDFESTDYDKYFSSIES